MEKRTVRVEKGQTLQQFVDEELSKPANVEIGLTLAALKDESDERWAYLRKQEDISFLLNHPDGTPYPGPKMNATASTPTPTKGDDPLAIEPELVAATPEAKPTLSEESQASGDIGKVNWVIPTVNVSGKISFSALGPFVMIDKCGVLDLLPQSPFPVMTKKSMRAEAILRRLAYPAFMSRIKESDGMIPTSANAHDYSIFDPTPGNDRYAYEASLRRMEVRDSTNRRMIPYNHPLVGGEGGIETAISQTRPPDDVRASDALPLSRRVLVVLDYALALNDEVRRKYEFRIDMNPYRAHLLLRMTEAMKYIVLPRSGMDIAFRADGIVNQGNERLHDRRRLTDIEQYDQVNRESERVRVYHRFYDVMDMGRWYYGLMDMMSLPDIRSAAASRVRKALQDYSYSQAQAFFSGIVTPSLSMGLVTSNAKGQTAWSTLMATYITPAPSAEFMRVASAVLLGARHTRFTIQVDSEITGDRALEPSAIAALGTLAMVDSRWIIPSDLYMLVGQVLRPFYKLLTVDEAVQAYLTLGVRTVVNSNLKSGAADGPAERARVTASLFDVLDAALATTFTQMASPRFYHFDSQPMPYSMIPPPMDNVSDMGFLLGRDRHTFSQYNAYVRSKLDIIEKYAQLLDKQGRERVNFWTQAIIRTPQLSTLSPGCAYLHDCMLRGVQRIDIVSGGIPDPDSDNFDVVELPYYGALSFLLFGVGTPYHTNPDDPTAIPYVHVMEHAIPDQTTMYYFYEKEIARMVYNAPGMATYRDIEDDVIRRTVETIIRRYFSSIPPGFMDRMDVYFEYHQRFLPAGAGTDLPPEFQMQAIRTTNDLGAPYGHGTPGPDYSLYRMFGPDRGVPVDYIARPLFPLQEMLMIDNSLADSLYISEAPVMPCSMFSKTGQKILLWCLPSTPDQDECISLFDLVRALRLHYYERFSVEKIRNLLRAYKSTRNVPLLKYVTISESRFRYDMKEVSAEMDVVNETAQVEIVPKTFERQIKYQVDKVMVHWMMYNTRVGDLAIVLPNAVPGVHPLTYDEGLRNMALSVHAVCVWDDLVRRFANVKLQLNGFANDFEANVKRIYSGTGFTVSTQVCVSMRKEQMLQNASTIVRVDPL